MRLIALLTMTFLLAATVQAAGPDDQYVDIYNQILQAESMQSAGQNTAAAQKFHDAQLALQGLQNGNPSWNPDVVKFRLQYLGQKMQELGKYLPAAPAPAPVVSPVAAATPQQQLERLQGQIGTLQAENMRLNQKLKEALSVQPAAISPAELTKAQERIAALEKENDLLKVTLEQRKAEKPTPSPAIAPAPTPAPTPDNSAKLSRELAETKSQVAQLKLELIEANKKAALAAATPAPTPTPVEAKTDNSELMVERDRLKSELEQRNRDLADAEAHRGQELTQARADLKKALQDKAESQAKLAGGNSTPAVSVAPIAPKSNEMERKVEKLESLIAVLEAKTVPLTVEELAVIKQAPTRPLVVESPVSPSTKRTAHSSKDLPPGAGALMADALRLAMERNYAQSEEKYRQVLVQDEDNVYVLAHLANAQFAAGELGECEKTVQKALALDPDDAASLYLLGVLRYRQENVDAALDALSRSAKYNPTNAGTQNYLGCVLAEKKLLPAAETALRKALQLDPEYADAHYNLAFIYATEKPPSPELARWHYQRAKGLGHEPNPQLEKLLGDTK